MGNFIGNILKSAVSYAPYAKNAYDEVHSRNLMEAAQKTAQDRQAKQDALAQALGAANLDHIKAQTEATRSGMGDDAVTYIKDADNNYVAVPKKLPHGMTGQPAAPSIEPPAQTPMPDFSGPSATDWTKSLRGPQQAPAPQQGTLPQQATPPAPKPPKSFIGTPTGIQGPTKAPAPPKIDPRSVPGISADSARAVNTQAAKVNNPPPARPGTASKPGPYSQEAITADSIKAANRAALKPGGMTGGMGSGGIGGLARTSGAITEMAQADQLLTPYEEQIRSGHAKYDGLDYFTGLRGKMYDAHGVVDQATHAAAFGRLNQVNPDLANYLRAAEMWALADGAVSGKTSDFRTKLDGFVSAIGPHAGPSQIANTQQGRKTRLGELQKFQPAMRAAADRFVPPGQRSPASTGNVDLGAPSPLRQKYDAAVSHLKGQGKSDADILKTLGTPPGDE